MEFLKTYIKIIYCCWWKLGVKHLDQDLSIWIFLWFTFHEGLNALFIIMLYLLPLSINSIHLSAILFYESKSYFAMCKLIFSFILYLSFTPLTPTLSEHISAEKMEQFHRTDSIWDTHISPKETNVCCRLSPTQAKGLNPIALPSERWIHVPLRQLIQSVFPHRASAGAHEWSSNTSCQQDRHSPLVLWEAIITAFLLAQGI